MGKKAPSQPSAAQQGAANMDAAIATGLINRYNTVSPFGNTTYNKIGTETVGSGKNARDVPMYEQIIDLSPSQQRQLDLTNSLSENALGVGNTMFGNVAGSIQNPFNPQGLANLDADLIGARDKAINDMYGLQTKRLDDRFGRQEQSMVSQLANQGIMQGSEAFTNAMKDFNMGKNDAYDQAMRGSIEQGNTAFQALNNANLANRQQGYKEASYERSLPINELSSLLGFNGGIQSPDFAAPPQVQVAPGQVPQAQGKDYSGVNAAMGLAGSLFGGGTMPWIFSDARVKDDVRRVGTLDNGLPVYSFKYKGSDATQIGVMAQDVEKVKPEAVIEIDGIKAVNYAEAVQ